MQFILNRIKGLVYSHGFISLMAALYYLSCYQLAGGAEVLPLEALLIFGSTYIAYNFFRVFSAPVSAEDLREKEQWHLRWRRGVRLGLVLSVLLCLVITCFVFSHGSFLFLLHLGLISLCYNAPKQWPKRWQIRQYPLLKVFIVAYVWAMMAVALPILLHPQLGTLRENLPLLIGQFFFIAAITIPFDVKDWEDDHLQGLMTLPHRLGLKGAIGLAMIFLALAFLFLYPYAPLASGVTFLASGLLILNTHKRRSEWYYTLGLDGIFLLYYLSLQLAGK